MPSVSILIVGNVYKDYRLFKRHLNGKYSNVSLIETYSFENALKVLDETSVDAVICLHSPPEVDGLRLIKEVRKNSIADTPAVLMLNESDEQLIENAYRHGADRCIVKRSALGRKKNLAREIDHLIMTARARSSIRTPGEEDPHGYPRSQGTLLNILEEPAFLLDSVGTILGSNRAAGKQFGRKRTSIIGENVFEIFGQEVIEGRKKALLAALKSSKAVRHRDREGSAANDIRFIPLFDESGRLQCVAMVFKDVSEHARIEDELQESMDDFRAVIDALESGVLVTDLDLGWTHYNRPFLDMWGFDEKTRSRCDDQTIFKIAMERLETPEGFVERIREIFARPEEKSSDIIRLKDGRIFERISIPRWHKGKIDGRVWIFRDVTERETYQEKLRSILDGVSGGIVLYDENYDIVYANRTAARNAGLTLPLNTSAKSETQVAEHVNIRTEDGQKIPPEQFPGRQALTGTEVKDMIIRYTNAAGEECLGTLDAVPLRDSQGHVHSALVSVHDITDIKRIEAELRKTRDQLDAILSAVPGSLIVYDRDVRIAYCNDTAIRRIGADSLEELQGEFPAWYFEQFDYFDEQGNTLTTEDFPHAKLLRNESADPLMVRLVNRETGREGWAYITGAPVYDANGEVEFAVVMIFDSTEQKRVEKELVQARDNLEEVVQSRTLALRESRKYLEQAQRIAKLGHFIWHTQDDRTELSEQLIRMTGVDTGRRVTMRDYLRVVHPDDRKRVLGLIAAALEGRKRYSTEHRIIAPDGEVRFVYTEGEIETDESGKIRHIVGTMQDITERKESEIKLKQIYEKLEQRSVELEQSQQILKRAQQIAHLGHWIWSYDEDDATLSEEGFRILGIEPAPDFRFTDYLERVHPDDRERVISDAEDRLSDRPVTNLGEHRIVRPDGEIRYLFTTSEVEFDDDGCPHRTVGVIQDITERKKAELDLSRLNEELRERTAELAESQKYLKWGEHIAKLGYFVWDFKTDTATVSEEFNRMMDAGEDKVWSWEEFTALIHPDDAEMADRNIRKSVEAGKPYRSEYRVRTLSGREMYLADVGEVLLDEDGEPYLLVGVQQDITERKEAELELKRLNEELEKRTEELRENRMYLERAQRIASVGHFLYYVAEQKGIVSEQFNRLMGATDLNRIWSHLEYIDAVHPDDREEVRDILETAFANGTSYSTEHRICQPDGTVLYINAEAEMELNEDGSAYRAIGTIQDVTKRKLAELELRELHAELEKRVELRTRELQQANEELEAFSYAVSHDLRAPLRHIRGFSEMLGQTQKERLDDEGVLCINRIEQSTDSMEELITGLLWLSRSSRLEPERKTVNLSALAESVARDLRDSDPERDLKMTIAPDLTDECDEKLINVVLQNLFSNAHKFTALTDGKTVEFGARETEGERIYFVSDNGVGFDPGLAQRLFQPFKRLHESKEFPGIGIGLATVKRVIERHGGRIWAESKPGEGATFYFTLK